MQLNYELQQKVKGQVEGSLAFHHLAEAWENLVDANDFKYDGYGEAFAYASMRDSEDGYCYEDDGNLHVHYKGLHLGVSFGQESRMYVADEKKVAKLAKQLVEENASEYRNLVELMAEQVEHYAPLNDAVEAAEQKVSEARKALRDAENELNRVVNRRG